MTESRFLDDHDLLPRFLALTELLREHQDLWRPKPFTALHLPWEARYPQLATWLRGRSLDDAESAQMKPHLLDAPAPFPQIAAQAAALANVGELSTTHLHAAAARLSVDVPGRKWNQIEAFASHLSFIHTPGHWLDWCAGKGHLGRRLLDAGQHLTCLEFDPALVHSGQQLSDRHHLSATHQLQDVMASDTASRLHAKHTPVALHACGDLHVRLIDLASQTGCAQLAIAPCCYNRTQADHHQPLSTAARAANLTLDRDELGLPMSETVTAGARVRRQRDTSMARRLAFDLLQRQVRNTNHYLPTPSLPSAWLDKPFANWCRDLWVLKDLGNLPEQDWTAAETAGWQRLAQVRNLELVRNLFRRPLELWLVLDRALYLREQGYRVRLGTFCAAELTPRNLLLIGERVSAD